jgi:hydrogenase nickel incorporation protein HypA/HybF
MHELSIAESIVDIVRQHVAPDRLCAVRSVGVKVGACSGVVPDSLEFSYQAITSGTPLAQSMLALECIPFVVRCRQCSRESANADGIILCSACGSFDTIILSGRELQMKEIELEDMAPEHVHPEQP